ncbi:hypothetical protein WN51_11013 [Melipona quadrifasciata]|uniref:Uncharacterized protein n=1 Tax=Melipona quadrifasciata TaxID=166423 RepID=A0A0M9A3T6_9HYME|nr:hypothetical protein WN51_11013 [Melipona quadrifasciata]
MDNPLSKLPPLWKASPAPLTDLIFQSAALRSAQNRFASLSVSLGTALCCSKPSGFKILQFGTNNSRHAWHIISSQKATVHHCGKLVTHGGYDASQAFRNRILLAVLGIYKFAEATVGVAMPTYHNAGGGYPNVSAPVRQAKLDGNHHTIPSNVTSHPLIQNSTQHNVPSNLSASNIPSHPVSPTMTTHSSVTTPNITNHMNTASPPVILTPNVTPNVTPNSGNPAALPVNPRHECLGLSEIPKKGNIKQRTKEKLYTLKGMKPAKFLRMRNLKGILDLFGKRRRPKYLSKVTLLPFVHDLKTYDKR